MNTEISMRVRNSTCLFVDRPMIDDIAEESEKAAQFVN